MHIHILGICGTFMGGIAAIARAAGHTVTGCDANVYPPMSTQLEALGIQLIEGYHSNQLDLNADTYVIGNVIARGKHPLMEAILDRGLAYVSGPQWLAEHVLRDKWVLAVAGTHGKTTTSSMLAWILEYGGLNPGYLIGGVPMNFGVSARLTDSPFFVIEADEYDTAFFDKRSKFVHYRPRTCVLNNLEFDHADIFPDLAAIETQFHHLLRTVPSSGLIITNHRELSLNRVLQRGCWSAVEHFGCDSIGSNSGWQAHALNAQDFSVNFAGQPQGQVQWPLLGEHNRMNALAALAAARHAGVPAAIGCEALNRFENVRRRLELRGVIAAACVLLSMLIVYGFDYYRLDFAHRVASAKHPLLRPSGSVGRRLGMLGGVMFALVFLYPLRKHWPWLATKGKTKNWLDCHILLGLTAPGIITFHSSFKFNGVAGLAYWIMLAIVLSGIVGRYLYAQIPRRLDTAEMSLEEAQAANAELVQRLRHQTALPLAEVEKLFHLPGKEEVQSLPLWKALATMIAIDLERPVMFWKVRQKAWREGRTGAEFNGAISALKLQSKLAKEIVFLSQAERIFHLWHVVHRPFSHAFGILSALHVTIVFLLGYY